jgi:hypothetical protein
MLRRVLRTLVTLVIHGMFAKDVAAQDRPIELGLNSCTLW